FSENENRARVTSAVVTGLFISGDDFSDAGSPLGKERARKFLTNPSVDALVRLKKSFRPIEGNTGNRAASIFSSVVKGNYYLAAFNYSKQPTNFSVVFSRIGLKTQEPVKVNELWRNMVGQATNVLTIRLAPMDAAIYELVTR
ncbi:MAG TPA: alpha-galactosidase, partial [Verrucomicrobiae bacterium]|nr:alpha-galactosidase [Verrucomicrobiae bacterium]